MLEFFSSPIGLGHVTRDIAVAGYLEDETRFVTGGGAAELLRRTGWNVQDAYDPPPFDVRDGRLQSPARWLWRYYQYYRNCKAISARIMADDGPDLVISDEDFASLAVAQKTGRPTVLITDITETRFTRGVAAVIERRMNRSMREIIQGCDSVIIPEHGRDEGNVKRVGPIVRQTGMTRDQLRAKFRFERPTVLISAGGTDAGLFLIQKAVDALAGIRDVDLVVASGPSITRRFANVRNLGFVENLHELIFAADVLVALAGKSTIDEANSYGTPAIFIPIRGHFEQEDNARSEGFEFEDVYRLEELVAQKLSEKRRRTDADGAKKASEVIGAIKA